MTIFFLFLKTSPLCVRDLLICWCCLGTMDVTGSSSNLNCIKKEIGTICYEAMYVGFTKAFFDFFQNIVSFYGRKLISYKPVRNMCPSLRRFYEIQKSST